MITLSRVKKATSEFIKVLRFGNIDVQTPIQILPKGIDSKPIKDDVAVHSTTQNNDESIVLGYTLESEKTEEGETRIYATDKEGNEVFDILLKNDGTCEFGGNTDFFIRYNALNSALQLFVTNLNSTLATTFTNLGATWVPVTLNISASKIEGIKTS